MILNKRYIISKKIVNIQFTTNIYFRLICTAKIELDNVDRLKSTYQSNYHIDFKNWKLNNFYLSYVTLTTVIIRKK